MSEDEIAALLRYARVIEVPARYILLHAGEAGDSLYVLLAGKVKISLLSVEGKEAILSLIHAQGLGAGKALLRLPPSPSGGEDFPALGRRQGWGPQSAHQGGGAFLMTWAPTRFSKEPFFLMTA